MTLRPLHHCAAAALLAVAVTGIVPSRVSPAAQAESASPDSRSLFEGDWEGALVSRPLTFRFRLENGVLLGWFVSAKNGQLYPLKNVEAKKRTLSFVHASNPELSVVMTLLIAWSAAGAFVFMRLYKAVWLVVMRPSRCRSRLGEREPCLHIDEDRPDRLTSVDVRSGRLDAMIQEQRRRRCSKVRAIE